MRQSNIRKLNSHAAKLELRRLYPTTPAPADTYLQELHRMMRYERKKISIPTGKTVRLQPIAQILYVKADSSYSTIYTTDGQKIFTSKNIKYWEEKIGDTHFVRCHQTYLVNVEHIQSIDVGESTLHLEGYQLPVSRAKKALVLALFE